MARTGSTPVDWLSIGVSFRRKVLWATGHKSYPIGYTKFPGVLRPSQRPPPLIAGDVDQFVIRISSSKPLSIHDPLPGNYRKKVPRCFFQPPCRRQMDYTAVRWEVESREMWMPCRVLGQNCSDDRLHRGAVADNAAGTSEHAENKKRRATLNQNSAREAD